MQQHLDLGAVARLAADRAHAGARGLGGMCRHEDIQHSTMICAYLEDRRMMFPYSYLVCSLLLGAGLFPTAADGSNISAEEASAQNAAYSVRQVAVLEEFCSLQQQSA